MRIYFRNYRHRIVDLLCAIAVLIVALCTHNFIFHGSIIAISNQLSTYDSSDYSFIYRLNYDSKLNNQLMYPDTDIQLFADEAKERKLSVSGMMVDEECVLTLRDLQFLNDLSPEDLAVASCVADKYGLKIGDSVYALYPYSTDVKKLTVAKIVSTDFDVGNPNISNDVGMVFYGFDHQYKDNTNCKYAVYAQASLAEDLSKFPQIIDGVVSKSDNYEYVFRQGLHILLLELFFILCGIIMAHKVFFFKSNAFLKRCFVKGMKRFALRLVPFVERLVILCAPFLIMAIVFGTNMRMDNVFSICYFTIPSFLILGYCIVPLVRKP